MLIWPLFVIFGTWPGSLSSAYFILDIFVVREEVLLELYGPCIIFILKYAQPSLINFHNLLWSNRHVSLHMALTQWRLQMMLGCLHKVNWWKIAPVSLVCSGLASSCLFSEQCKWGHTVSPAPCKQGGSKVRYWTLALLNYCLLDYGEDTITHLCFSKMAFYAAVQCHTFIMRCTRKLCVQYIEAS